MFELPGINDKIFLSSFWPSLYSGIISGIITGIIVGLFIWIVQKYIDNKHYKNQLEREFLLFKESIRYIIDKQEIITITSAVISSPLVAKEIIKSIKNKPIELWKNNLKKYSSLINQILEIRNLYLTFNSVAEKLDTKLKQLIRQYNFEKNIIAINDTTDISHIIGRIYGYNTENILPWLDMPNKSVIIDGLENSYVAVKDDENVKKFVDSLLITRKTLVEKLNNLKVTLA